MNKLTFLFFISFSFLFSQENNIYNQADKSVFKIIGYDLFNQSLSQGSGVFITSNGVGVSNYHVLENIDSAYIITNTGKKYKITNIIDYSTDYDLIKFNTEFKNSTPSKIDIQPAQRGNDVFALGYPCGIEISGGSTLSKGIISAVRNIDSKDYIQSSAQITHGSSGGGLFNKSGNLIGLTQGTFASNIEDVHANMYKVIPSKYINYLSKIQNLSFQDLKNQNSDIRLARFDFLKDNNQLTEAELIIKVMLSNDILNARLWSKYAAILGKYKLDNKELAIECMENAIKLDPNNITYFSNYSIICSEYSMYHKALEILNTVNQLNKNSHFYYALGYCYAGMKSFDKAIDCLNRSLDLVDPNIDSEDIYKKTLYELAYSYKNVKKYDLSIKTCNLLSVIFPDYYTVYNLRAQNYYLLGNFSAACIDFNFVIQNGDELNKRRALEGQSIICK